VGRGGVGQKVTSLSDQGKEKVECGHGKGDKRQGNSMEGMSGSSAGARYHHRNGVKPLEAVREGRRRWSARRGAGERVEGLGGAKVDPICPLSAERVYGKAVYSPLQEKQRRRGKKKFPTFVTSNFRGKTEGSVDSSSQGRRSARCLPEVERKRGH